jgi:hypothetical protein
VSREFQLVEDQRRKWARLNRRLAVPPVAEDRVYGLSVGRMVTIRDGPRFPTAADILPFMVVRGMPASEYPKYAMYLVAYSLAAAAIRSPFCADVIWTPEWERMASVVVGARVGVWAATGYVPEREADALSDGFRWSVSLKKVVSRPPEDDATACLFRHFLSLAPDATGAMHAAVRSVMWVAPVMLLAATSRAVRNEGSYASSILEGVVKRHMRVERGADTYLDLMAAVVWDTFRAASTAGYSIERLRALSSDMAYGASAQLRVATEGALELKRQLDDALASDAGAMDFDDGGELSDTASIADTEVGSPVTNRSNMCHMPRVEEEASDDMSFEPPPPLDVKQHEELTAAIRSVKPMSTAWESLRRMPQAIETEVHF